MLARDGGTSSKTLFQATHQASCQQLDKSVGAQRWRMSPNGNGFVRVESADSMEEPLLSPGFTSTVERPVEDLLVSVWCRPIEPEPIEPDFRGKSTPKSTTFRHSPRSPVAVNRQGCVAAGRDGRCRGSQTCRGAIRRGRVSPGRTEEAVLRATAGTCPISNPNIDVTKFNRAPPVDPYPPSPRHSHWPGPTGIG